MAYTDEELLEWAEFVATKFVSNTEGWTRTRNLGSLEHIRYREDYTGYNVWWRRLYRGIRGSKGLAKEFRPRGLMGRWVWFLVSIEKDNHLPDNVVNKGSIICHWEEDAEYITFFGPTIGTTVIEWIRSDPENEHAKRILAEMRRVTELSLKEPEQ